MKKLLIFFGILFGLFFYSFIAVSAQSAKDFTVNADPGQAQIDLGENANIDIWNLPLSNTTYSLAILTNQGEPIDSVSFVTKTNGTCEIRKSNSPLSKGAKCGKTTSGDTIGYQLNLNTNDLNYNEGFRSYTYELVLSGGAFGRGVSRPLTVNNQGAELPDGCDLPKVPISITPSGNNFRIDVLWSQLSPEELKQYRLKRSQQKPGAYLYVLDSDGEKVFPVQNISLIDDPNVDDKALNQQTILSNPLIKRDSSFPAAVYLFFEDQIPTDLAACPGIGEGENVITISATSTRQIGDECDPNATASTNPNLSCEKGLACKQLPPGSGKYACSTSEGDGSIELISPKSSEEWPKDDKTDLSIPVVNREGNTITLAVNGLQPDFCYYLTLSRLTETQQEGTLIRPTSEAFKSFFTANPKNANIQNCYSDRRYYVIYELWDTYNELIDKYPNMFAIFDGRNGPEQEIKIPMLSDDAYIVRVYNIGTSGFGAGGRKSDDGLFASQKILVGTGVTPGTIIPPCTQVVVRDRAANTTTTIPISPPDPKVQSLRDYYQELFDKSDGKYEFIRCAEVQTAIGPFRTDPAEFITTLMGFLLGISGAIALLLIIRAGYIIMISRADPEKVGEAKEILTSAIVGLLFIIFSLVILEIIGVDILQIPGFCADGPAGDVCRQEQKLRDADIGSPTQE